MPDGVSGATRAQIEAAYRSHGHHVERRATRLLGSAADAREIVHEVFVSLLEEPTQFGGRSALTTWLYSATTNRCLNRIRDTRNHAQILASREAALTGAEPGTAAEDAAELRALLTRLPDELARVAVYYYGDEMTHAEIAKILGCSRRHVGDLVERLTHLVNDEEATR